MKGVQCYELFGGIALKNHEFSFSIHEIKKLCVNTPRQDMKIKSISINQWQKKKNYTNKQH